MSPRLKVLLQLCCRVHCDNISGFKLFKFWYFSWQIFFLRIHEKLLRVIVRALRLLWQSPKGKRWLTHWASMLRWRRSISEYNLKTRDSPKRTLKSGPFVRERRGSGPAKQKPKHNPCRPVVRNWKTKNGYLPREAENCVTSSVIGPKMTTWPCGGKSQAPGHWVSG